MSRLNLSKENKMTAQFMLGVASVLAGLTMLFFGMFMPPKGSIDSSVLIAFGEVATFAGSLIGIDYSYKYKIYSLENKDKKE